MTEEMNANLEDKSTALVGSQVQLEQTSSEVYYIETLETSSQWRCRSRAEGMTHLCGLS